MTLAEKFTRPTPQRLDQASGAYEYTVIDDVDRQVVTIRIHDSLLDRLIRRKPPALSGDQFNSGQQLYEDWYCGFGYSLTTRNLARDIVDNSTSDPDTEKRMAAKQRYYQAIKGLWNKHAMVLRCCVLQEETLESFGCRIRQVRNRKRGREAALDLLRDALDQLVEHYHGKRSGGIRAAHEPGYRPRGLEER
jgi:hypothetical protein